MGKVARVANTVPSLCNELTKSERKNKTTRAQVAQRHLCTEIAEYAGSGPMHLKWWKMVCYSLESGHLDRDFNETNQQIPKKRFEGMVRNLSEPLGGVQSHQVVTLVNMILNSEYETLVTRELLVKFSKLDEDRVGDLFKDWAKSENKETLEQAQKREAAVNAIRAQEAMEREMSRAEDDFLIKMTAATEKLGPLTTMLLKNRVLPNTCSLALEENETFACLRGNENHPTAKSRLGLDLVKSLFAVKLDQYGDDAKSIAKLHKGDGDFGMCDALSRTVWGSEIFSGYLDACITSEMKRHKDWYVTFISCVLLSLKF
jgi:hypothetical protein